MKISILIMLGLITIFILPSVLGADANEYLQEFNEAGENCQIIDVFEYQIPSSRILNGDTVPVFYNCYTENGDSTIIIFDVYNQIFLDEQYLNELIDLAYIKANLNNNRLSEYHFVSKGLDICNYFGSDKINQESINLVAHTAQAATPLINSKTAKDVSDAIRIGKNIKVIGQFNPTTLIISVGCKVNNKLLKESIESLALCNSYLINIGNNVARKDYVSELDYCITDAKSNLKKFIDDGLSQMRDAVNQAGNVIWGTVKPLAKLFQDVASGSTNLELDEIKIEETDMDIAKRIYDQISDDTSHLYHPDKSTILRKHQTRIENKARQYNNKYYLIVGKYDNVSEMKPSFIEILFTDIFKNPNYNISFGAENLKNATKVIGWSGDLFEQNRFNTAISYIDYADSKINAANEIILREVNVQREWDNVIIGMVAIVLVFLIVKFIILRNRD